MVEGVRICSLISKLQSERNKMGYKHTAGKRSTVHTLGFYSNEKKILGYLNILNKKCRRQYEVLISQKQFLFTGDSGKHDYE